VVRFAAVRRQESDVNPDDVHPDDVPIRYASTLVLIDDRPDLQVLMLRRNAHSEFVADYWMFPGGALDDQDGHSDADSLSPTLSQKEANLCLRIDDGARNYWIAALRETFEEAFVLLASSRENGQPVDLRDTAVASRFEAHRTAVERGERTFFEILRDENLVLDVDAMHYIARWITPQGPPRRYDTRFFLAAMPQHQTATHDNREAVHSEWIRPTDALQRFTEGESLMLPPTRGVLQVLSAFDNSQQALAEAAAQRNDADRAARRTGTSIDGPLLLPGDAGYDAASPLPFAWVRFVAPPRLRATPPVPYR